MSGQHNRTCPFRHKSRRQFLGTIGAAAAGMLVGGLGSRGAFGQTLVGSSTKVSVSSVSNYSRASLRSAIASMFEGIGGLEDIVSPGDHVGIKINLTGGHSYASSYSNQTGLHPGETFWTHPEVLRAVGELILDAGAGKITIVEAIYDPESYFQWGYSEAGAHLGADFVDLNETAPYAGYTVRPATGSWFIYKEFTQNGILNDFDCVVSLAKSKQHNGAGVTHGMKNLVGTLPIPSGLYNAGQGYRAAIHDHRSHDGNPYSNLRRVVLDLNRATPINLVVNDAITTVLGGEGPWGPLTPVSFGTLVASKDPVAADAIATQAIGFDPGAADGSTPFADGINYLTHAEQLGMGTADLSSIDVVNATTTNTDPELPNVPLIQKMESFPNPFDHRTTITFSLAGSAIATVAIIDIVGKRIRSYPAARFPAGVNRVEWDGKTDHRGTSPPGVYIAIVEAGGSRRTHKMIRID